MARWVLKMIARARHIVSTLSGRRTEAAREEWHESTVRLRNATCRLEERTRSLYTEDAAAQALERLEAATRALRLQGK